MGVRLTPEEVRRWKFHERRTKLYEEHNTNNGFNDYTNALIQQFDMYKPIMEEIRDYGYRVFGVKNFIHKKKIPELAERRRRSALIRNVLCVMYREGLVSREQRAGNSTFRYTKVGSREDFDKFISDMEERVCQIS